MLQSIKYYRHTSFSIITLECFFLLISTATEDKSQTPQYAMSGDIKKILTRYIEDERKNVANDKKCMENIDKLEKED